MSATADAVMLYQSRTAMRYAAGLTVIWAGAPPFRDDLMASGAGGRWRIIGQGACRHFQSMLKIDERQEIMERCRR